VTARPRVPDPLARRAGVWYCSPSRRAGVQGVDLLTERRAESLPRSEAKGVGFSVSGAYFSASDRATAAGVFGLSGGLSGHSSRAWMPGRAAIVRGGCRLGSQGPGPSVSISIAAGAAPNLPPVFASAPALPAPARAGSSCSYVPVMVGLTLKLSRPLAGLWSGRGRTLGGVDAPFSLSGAIGLIGQQHDIPRPVAAR